MRKILQTVALSASLFACASSAANAQVSFGFRIGEPPPARAYRVPRQPIGDYTWVEGYWYPQGGKYRWHNGYWTRPPYEGAYWVAPYHLDGQYYAGQWEGSRGNMAHNHGWDRGKQRDERRYRGPVNRDDNRNDRRNDGRDGRR